MSAANLNNVPQSVMTPSEVSISATNTAIIPPSSDSLPETLGAPSKIDSESERLTSTRFAHLSKKEQALVKDREALKNERAQFLKDQETYKIERAESSRVLAMAKEITDLQLKDPVAAMKKAGFSETDIYNFMSAQEDTSTPEDRAMKAAHGEIEKFKTEQAKMAEEQNKLRINQQKAEDDKKITIFQSNIGKHITADKDKYEYLNHYGDQAQNLVYETISNVLAEDGVMLSIEEAAQMVETYYEDEDKALNSLKKRQSKQKEINASKLDIIEHSDSELVKQALNARSSVRIPAKQYEDNKVPIKTIENRYSPPINNAANAMTTAQRKQMIVEKYKNRI